jgi:hypothetical protein
MFAPDRARIITSGTLTLIGVTRFVAQVVIVVNNAGTSWKLKIQDRASPAFVLVPEVTLSAPSTANAVIENFQEPIRMEGGIDIVTTGTPGEVAVWFSYGEAS